jgi:hypothetical protein
MKSAPPIDVEKFWREGYLHIKGVFSREEMSNVRKKLEKIKRKDVESQNYIAGSTTPKVRFLLGDMLSKTELRDQDFVVLDDRVVAYAKQILGDDLVYFGDSSVQCGEGLRGYHKDNVDRYDPTKPDWQGKYTLIKFGVYVQDHANHSGGLKVRKNSYHYPSYHKGWGTDIRSEVGDLVVWNLRTTHSGNNVRLRLMPGLCLHPRLEALVPDFLKIPEECERFFISCTFGLPDAHLDQYIANMIKRGDYRQYFLRSGINRDLQQLIASKGIKFRMPIPEYGELFPEREPIKV